MDRVSHAITTHNSSAPRVQAKTYTASFDGSGVHFWPHRPFNQDVTSWKPGPRPGGRFGRPEPDAEIILCTKLIHLENQVLYLQHDRPLSWSLVGNTAQALLNEDVGLVHHCETGGKGVEVSWVFKKRPAGEGPLTIEFAVKGLTYQGASVHGNHLVDAGGLARVRIGQAVAVDSKDLRCELPTVASSDRFSICVPGEFLAKAAFPLAVDPTISPEFGMDQPVTVPRPGEHQLPAAAWNGTNWLVVWAELPGFFESPVDVVGARVSKEGALLDPLGILISRWEVTAAPSVASNGRDYLVVWDRWDRVTEFDIAGARVTADGEVADSQRIVISNLPADQFQPSVAGDREGYLVVWKDRRTGDANIFGARVSNEGTVLDGDGFPIRVGFGEKSRPSVARGPGGFLAVWSQELGAIFGARLDRNGTVLDPNGIAVSGALGDQMYPSVAANSNAYLVAWHNFHSSTPNPEETDVYGALVTPAGDVSAAQVIASNTLPYFRASPGLGAGTDDFLVAWNDLQAVPPGIYASRISSSGAVLDPGAVLIDSVPGTLTPAVAAYDNGFLVVWNRASSPQGGFGSAIFASRLNTQVERLDPQPLLITAKDNDETSPAVASNGTNWLVVWEDWRSTDNIDIYGARIGYNGTPLDLVAIPISTQPRFKLDPAVASAGGDYLVVWVDGRNAGFPYTDIYGARVRTDGTVLDPAGIAICTAASGQITPAISSDGENYLVTWADARVTNTSDIYAARVNQAGTVLEPDGFAVNSQSHRASLPTAAFNGQEFLVAWSQSAHDPEHDGDILGARVSRDGIVLDPDAILITSATNAQRGPAIAAAGSDFLVIWADTRNTVTPSGDTFGGEIYGARIDAGGIVLDPLGFRISSTAYGAFPALGSDGTNFVAVWASAGATPGTNRQVLAAWIDRNGQVLLRDLTVNTTGLAGATLPVVASARSGEFVVLSEALRNGANRIVGNLLSLAFRPTIQSLTLAAGGATLEWSTQPARTYRLQFTSNLRNAEWLDLEPIITATSNSATLLDSTVGQDPQRFYRVYQLP
ncbi:MAG TPA: hypothetical protein VJA21_33860 [Verrucomicrobiae bacterium]